MYCSQFELLEDKCYFISRNFLLFEREGMQASVVVLAYFFD